MKPSTRIASLRVPLAPPTLIEAAGKTNHYLVKLPNFFKTGGIEFYSILNQRNISGLIGEVLKHAVHALDSRFLPNPHPDGRPDLLDLRTPSIKTYLETNCYDATTHAAIRERLAPFKYGGIEVKCTIGNLHNANESVVGVPRVEKVTGLTYWAHHAHDCNLLGIYYDYSMEHNGCPQIRAMFYAKITSTDWNKVSVGNPAKKKTSNTSLNASGVRKLYQSLAVYDSGAPYRRLLDRLCVPR